MKSIYQVREFYDLWRDEDNSYYFNNCCRRDDISFELKDLEKLDFSSIKNNQKNLSIMKKIDNSIKRQLKENNLISENLKLKSIRLDIDYNYELINVIDNRQSSKTYNLIIYTLTKLNEKE